MSENAVVSEIQVTDGISTEYSEAKGDLTYVVHLGRAFQVSIEQSPWKFILYLDIDLTRSGGEAWSEPIILCKLSLADPSLGFPDKPSILGSMIFSGLQSFEQARQLVLGSIRVTFLHHWSGRGLPLPDLGNTVSILLESATENLAICLEELKPKGQD